MPLTYNCTSNQEQKKRNRLKIEKLKIDIMGMRNLTVLEFEPKVTRIQNEWLRFN